MKINLTDQELNEWVAVNVMEWEIETQKMHLYTPLSPIPPLDIYYYKDKKSGKYINLNNLTGVYNEGKYFNPCLNLNHTYLMEEKIREMGLEYRDRYADNLIYTLYPNQPNSLFNKIHASARQRCEAAYLTFQEKK